MATTTATVTPEGLLALPHDFVAEHDLTPGTSIVITLGGAPRKIPPTSND